MKIEQIQKLADILYNILDEKLSYEVAMQSYPDRWFSPINTLQWYIDANWLIRCNESIYDPR